MTAHPLDRSVPRRGTGSVKWDYAEEGGEFAPVTDRDVIPMWVADMDFACPEAVTRAVARRMRNPIFGYSLETPGFAAAFADWNERRHGYRPDPGWVEPSEGVVPDLQHLVRGLLQPGEGVIVHPPVYYPFFGAARHGGAKLVRCPLLRTGAGGNPYRLDLERFARLAAEPGNRMTFLCSPHNPVGRVWTRSELADFARIARERDVIVVADEIHADLLLADGVRFTPWLSLDEADRSRSVVVTSPCKTFNIAGLKVSCLVIPDAGIRDAFRRARMRAGAYGVNPLSTAAAEAAWRDGDEWLDDVLGYLAGNAEEVARFFGERPGLGVSMTPIEATYLPWLDVRATGRTGDVAAFLLREARVRLKDGALFGAEGRGFVRMNIACPRSLLREALRRIGDTLGARPAS